MTDQIRTQRLMIRQPGLADAEACVRHLGNLAVARWLGMVPHPYTRADAVAFITEYSSGLPKSAFIFDADGLVGGIGIGDELGYWLAPHAWGKGYATEAATALIDHYFSTTRADAIRSGYFVGNVRSKNVLAKLGFTPTGRRKMTPRSTGLETEHFDVTLTRSNWEARA